jgi:hypothetical protein
MPVKVCSICSKPREILEAINTQIRQGVSPMVISKQCGIAKSILYRHRAKCLPKRVLVEQAAWREAAQFWQTEDGIIRNFASSEVVTELPSGPVWLFKIKYENCGDAETIQRRFQDEAAARSPYPSLSHDEATALVKKMAAPNAPPSDEAAEETKVDIINLYSPAPEAAEEIKSNNVNLDSPAPEPPRKLTPRQSERYKWLHAPLGMKHD